MNLVYRKDGLAEFDSLWNEFLKENKVDFHYELDYLDYTFTYLSEMINDESFLILQNGKCMGICICPIEKLENTNNISISNGYIPAPLYAYDKVKKKIYSKIEELISEYSVKKVLYYYTPYMYKEYNELLEFGFVDTSTTTCNVDLTVDKDTLWRGLRKSYKSLINALIKNEDYSLVYSNSENKISLHKKYTNFHKQHMINAGIEPKNEIVYNKQLDLLNNNLASVIAIKYKDEIIVTNYFFHNECSIAYASSAYDTREEFSSLALVHYLLWNAILHYKNKGYTYINFGQPCGYNQINGLGDYLDDKQVNISSFKRGMGAKMKTLYRGLKQDEKELQKFKMDI